MARKKRTPKGTEPSTTTAGKKKAPLKTPLKTVQKPRKRKDARTYTQFVRDLKNQDEPVSELPIPSGRPASRSKSLRSFQAIVETLQDVAVVDMKSPFTKVDFTIKGKPVDSWTLNAKGHLVKKKDKVIPKDVPGSSLQPLAFVSSNAMQRTPMDDSSTSSPSEEEGGSKSDEVYVIDMEAKQGGPKPENSKSRNQHKPKSSSPSPLRQSRKTRSSSSSSPHHNSKLQMPEKPSSSQKKRKKQSSGNKPSTSYQPSKNAAAAAATSQQSLRPQQLSRVQQEDSSGLSSNVSSDRSEMESDFSEVDLMSAESGDDEEEEEAVEVEEAGEEDAYFARYNKKGYKLLPHTIPTHCIAIIHPHSVLPFFGQVKMSVLHGEVKINGCTANKDSTPLVLYSPKSLAASCIETPETPFKLDAKDAGSRQELKDKLGRFFLSERAKNMTEEVLGLIQEHGVSVIAVESHWSDRTDYITSFPVYSELFQRQHHRRKGKRQSPFDDAVEIGFNPITPNPYIKIMTIPPFYHTVSESIMKALKQSGPGRPPVILVCGWKNVGKSTLVRYMINSMLSSCKSVCLLDCDVGQTEFNPPAMLGVTKVSQPLLGPPFTHEALPERMCFFGETSPASCPTVYMGIVRHLYQYYTSHLADLPLVINCMGWMKGLGLSLLVDTIKHIEPSHIIQLLPTPEPKNPPILNQTGIRDIVGWSMRESIRRDWKPEYIMMNTPWGAIDHGKYKAPHRRELSLLGYLSQLMPPKMKFHDPEAIFDPLPALEPYSVPWSSVAVHICNANVAPSQLMYALSASVVGLCRADKRQMASLDSEDADKLPKVFQSTPVCECLGLGIIRGIDPVAKIFYIITHLPESTLQDVNTLLKGSLALPKYVLQQGQRKGVTPYVTSDFPHDVTGTGSIKVKYMIPQGARPK